jgi:hypothetical protein
MEQAILVAIRNGLGLFIDFEDKTSTKRDRKIAKISMEINQCEGLLEEIEIERVKGNSLGIWTIVRYHLGAKTIVHMGMFSRNVQV